MPTFALKRTTTRLLLVGVLLSVGLLLSWERLKPIPTEGDWQSPFAVLSTAEFNGDQATVKNIRDFRYNGSEEEPDIVPHYYDKTFDLSQIKRVWYIAVPFSQNRLAAHTFLSFEFENNDTLTISIEARKTKGQDYSLVSGLFHTYPLIYIAADERDAILVRTNIRKDKAYLYPVKTEKGQELLTDILHTMNDLATKPEWYNTMTDNCTSRIAWHINRISPGRIPRISWQSFVTGFADEFALQHGLLDTDLTLEEARKRFAITKQAQEIGDTPDFSKRLRATIGY